MIITLAQFIANLVTVVRESGLTPNAHLLNPNVASSPSLSSTFCLDVQSANSNQGRQDSEVYTQHTVTVTFWQALPTKGSTDVDVWASTFVTEQAVITAVKARKMWWRSSYLNTARKINASGELLRVDVKFTLLAPMNVHPSS